MSITRQDLQEAVQSVKGEFQKTIQTLREDFDKKFLKNDKQFESLRDDFDKKFQQNDQRFDRMDQRLDRMEQRISDGIESVRVLVEEQRSDFKMAYEVLQHHKTRLDGHE
ncbi:MAG TPA: hypothetical protein VJL87_03850, partial [Bdellovibrionota bacterium]|nr:hypothetical protein [Bdellovibrionota bacterium]